MDEIASCTRCHCSRAGGYYAIHLMKVVNREWDKWKVRGKNFYVPVESVREFYCDRCSRRMRLWFHGEFVLWLILFVAVVVSAVLGALHLSGEDRSALFLFAAIFIWFPLGVGGFLLKEIGARLFAFSRVEAVEFRMKQRRRKMTTGKRSFYSDSHIVGDVGSIDVFTTAQRPTSRE